VIEQLALTKAHQNILETQGKCIIFRASVKSHNDIEREPKKKRLKQVPCGQNRFWYRKGMLKQLLKEHIYHDEVSVKTDKQPKAAFGHMT